MLFLLLVSCSKLQQNRNNNMSFLLISLLLFNWMPSKTFTLHFVFDLCIICNSYIYIIFINEYLFFPINYYLPNIYNNAINNIMFINNIYIHKILLMKFRFVTSDLLFFFIKFYLIIHYIVHHTARSFPFWASVCNIIKV